MKFTKLDIQSCLLSANINDFDGNINYFNDNSGRKFGKFGLMSIGISYNLFRKYENYYHFSNDKYAIYILEQDIINNNEVYSYTFLGISGNNFGKFEDKKLSERKILKNNTEIEKLEKELTELKGEINVSTKELRKLEGQVKKEQDKLLKNKKQINELSCKVEERNNNLSFLSKKIKGAEKKIKHLEKENKENKKIIDEYFYPYHIINDWDFFNKNAEKYFLFNNELYYTNVEKDRYRYNEDQIKLLLKEYVYKNNKKFESLKKQIESFEKINSNPENNRKREPISEEVKFEVWRRDEGKCVICGSKENLEFDHIIPFSKGGSSTVRNLQLLCEHCNRKKSNNI